jgi:hypothetical protein
VADAPTRQVVLIVEDEALVRMTADMVEEAGFEEKLAEKAEQGDIQATREIGDRLDGKAVQAIERGDAPIEAMTDQQLMAIAYGGPRELLAEPNYVRICRPVPDAEEQ